MIEIAGGSVEPLSEELAGRKFAFQFVHRDGVDKLALAANTQEMTDTWMRAIADATYFHLNRGGGGGGGGGGASSPAAAAATDASSSAVQMRRSFNFNAGAASAAAALASGKS